MTRKKRKTETATANPLRDVSRLHTPEPASAIVGLAAGRIEYAGDHEYRVRLTSGELVQAALGQGVESALADDCRRQERVVLLIQGAQGPVIVGALQTALTPHVDSHGELKLQARRVRIEASESFAVQAGADGVTATGLQLEQDGILRMRGERILVLATAGFKVSSALVELP